ncbi:MAG: serine hydrolase domain-containing protein [Bacteroidota bacterium]
MRLVLLLTFISLAFASISGQALTSQQQQAIDKLVMRDIPAGGPGAAVGIVKNGEIVYEKYAGLADIEGQRPIDANTRFNLASNAKQFTALSVLKLISEGKLSLDDDIRDYLPKLYPNLETPITVGQLINHTSGLRDVYNLWGLQGITWWEKTLSNQEALGLLEHQKDLNFPPGTEHLYSNSNYMVLTAIVAEVTGQSFKAYSDELFTALGMAETSFCTNHLNPIPNWARPYFNFDTWTTYEWLSDLHGDGALFSTLPDQLRWEQSVQTGTSPVLTEAQITASQLPIDVSVTKYGYGLETGNYRGMPIKYHDGSTGAWKASALRFPEERLSIVVLNNSGKFGTNYLAKRIADVLLEGQLEGREFPLGTENIGSPVAKKDMLGTYLIGGFYFRFVERDGQLFLEREGRDAVAIELEEGNVYHEIKDPDFKQVFTKDDSGRMQVTAYYPSHNPYTLKVIETDFTNYDFSALNGTYHNDEVGLTVHLDYKKDQEFTLSVADQEERVKLLKPDFLSYQGDPLEVVKNQQGQVAYLLYSDSRIKNLRLQRVENKSGKK